MNALQKNNKVMPVLETEQKNHNQWHSGVKLLFARSQNILMALDLWLFFSVLLQEPVGIQLIILILGSWLFRYNSIYRATITFVIILLMQL